MGSEDAGSTADATAADASGGSPNDIQTRGTASAKPTRAPTIAPTEAPTRCIEVFVDTGELYRKGGFTLSSKPGDGSAPRTLLDFPVGSLSSESAYAERACGLPDGTYTLTVTGRSAYSARIAGQEVLFDTNAWGETNSHDILIGYAPALGDDERAWVDEHNTRRRAFHEEHGEEYRPLRWSPALAQRAADWADQILPTCKAVREPKLEEGEIISLNTYQRTPRLRASPRSTEVPANILARWSDGKADLDYPANQALTQVMWRATRYVGCATKVAEHEDGTYCHVSICRYVRPGNCSLGAGNWLAKTLDEHSKCGPACPEEGCY